MPCCSGKAVAVKEPKPIRNDSESSSEKVKQNPEIEYSITVKTGNNRNASTDGPVYIKIFGRDDKQTDDILLSKSFQQNSKESLQIKAIDIGKPQRIIIRHEDKVNGWFIDYIEIFVHNFTIRFVANRWLNESKHDRKLYAELYPTEQQAETYNIEIQTGSEQIDSMDSPVYMQIFGTTTRTPKIFLEPKNGSFTKDSTMKFNVESNNVGEIQKIIIGHEGLGTVNDWYLENVKIQTNTQQQEFNVNKWLSPTKDDQKLSIELNRQAPRPPTPPKKKEIPYLITIKTGDVQQNRIIEKIDLNIRGTNGQIKEILSNENQPFQKGRSNQFEIEYQDIGDIQNITIGLDNNGQTSSAWLLESVDVKYKETTHHFQADCWLSSRLGANFNWITLKPDPNNNNIHYKIIVQTGESDIDANVILCIYGDKYTTNNLALRKTKDGIEAKFEKNSQLAFDLKVIDVGNIKKINIGHDGNEQKWFLKSVKIDKKDDHYIFRADQWLGKETENYIDLLPEEPKPKVVYKITTVTSSENESSTDSGVFMTIYGDDGQTKEFQLKKGNPDLLFQQGNTDGFEIELDDIGIINKINIRQDGKGLQPSWHLDSVRIQKGTEIYTFNADKVLDLSLPDIDLTPNPPSIDLSPNPPDIDLTPNQPDIDLKPNPPDVDLKPNPPEKSPSPKPEKIGTPRSTKSDKTQEIMYNISIRCGSQQQHPTEADNNLYMIIIGENGQTERISLPMNKKREIDVTATDVGKISKILLRQDESKRKFIWHIDNIIIKCGNDITTFNVGRSIEQNTEVELIPSPIRRPSETSTTVVKTKDTDYEIKTTTGGKTFQGAIILKIRGDNGIITIPLSKTKSGEKPFHAKVTDVFTTRTVNVGKIKRVILEHDGSDKENAWHLKKLQIFKGHETYNFKSNIRLDNQETKVTLYPLDQRKEDYVQSELRRLRENLRSESMKMRRPSHKAHEPFVYNDLGPYFDTTGVEKAIHEPLETPPGYYTRLTALRVVEPWEAYGMDYGVNYELLKQRRNRGHSAKRSQTKSDETIDRTQGSTHLPEFPCVNIQKPAEYHRPLTIIDVPKIRSFVRERYTAKASSQIEKDYKRTRDDFYRMQLDDVTSYHKSNRGNMVRVYHSYLENTPGSKKAVRELCEQIPLNVTHTTAGTAV